MFKVRNVDGIILIVYGVRTLEDNSTEFLLFNPIKGRWVWDEACCYTPVKVWGE